MPRALIARLFDVTHTWWRGLRFVASAATGAALPMGALTLAGGLLPVAQAWLSKAVVDALTTSTVPPAAALAPALLLVLALVVSSALQPVERALSNRVREGTVVAVDRALIAAGGRL